VVLGKRFVLPHSKQLELFPKDQRDNPALLQMDLDQQQIYEMLF
jgi:hypothetical protein